MIFRSPGMLVDGFDENSPVMGASALEVLFCKVGMSLRNKPGDLPLIGLRSISFAGIIDELRKLWKENIFVLSQEKDREGGKKE